VTLRCFIAQPLQPLLENLNSPNLTPSGSPRLAQRRTKSPMTLLDTSAATAGVGSGVYTEADLVQVSFFVPLLLPVKKVTRGGENGATSQ